MSELQARIQALRDQAAHQRALAHRADRNVDMHRELEIARRLEREAADLENLLVQGH